MPIRYLVLILLALHLCADPSFAQGDGTAVKSEWIQPSEVPVRAEALLRRLQDLGPKKESQESLARIQDKLAKIKPDIDAAIQRANAALSRSALTVEIGDALLELRAAAAPLAGWQNELAVDARQVADSLDEVAQAKSIWYETLGQPEIIAAGDTVGQRVRKCLDSLDEASAQLRTWRTLVMAVTDALIDCSAAVEATREKLEAAIEAQQENIFVPDSAPFWQSGFSAGFRSELPRVPEAYRVSAMPLIQYFKRDIRPFLVHALLSVFLIFFFRTLSVRASKLPAAEAATPQAARLLECPIAIGLLLALLAGPFLHPLAPRQFMQLLGLIAFFPAARILIHASGRADLITFTGLFLVLLLNRLDLAFVLLPALARMLSLLALAIGLGLAFWIKRHIRQTGGLAWRLRTVNLTILGIALAFLAEIGGWVNLATLLGRSIIAGAIMFLFVYAAVIVLRAFLPYALASAMLQRSRLFKRKTAFLQRLAERGLVWLGAAVWLYLTLTGIGLLGSAAGMAQALLRAGFSVGALSISVGGVLAFVLMLLTTIVFARIVNSVLEEEVYPRTRLPRGIPYVLSTLVRYVAYSLGFIFALAAAGVKLGQAAIMVGGLGVGIGLGLQDLVKNFAAGLTLLLERRLHVGDTLQIPGQDIFGRALSIGMRATVIRSWNGTEVVVPNSDLVSTPVTNWTLSDLMRRIEIPVGVAYGTDSERVVALLGDVARANLRVLTHPKPQGLFRSFGDSSLNFALRVWTDVEYEQTAPLISELGIEIQRRFKEAGITIPFPQRDLHIVSVAPGISAAMTGTGNNEQDDA